MSPDGRSLADRNVGMGTGRGAADRPELQRACFRPTAASRTKPGCQVGSSRWVSFSAECSERRSGHPAACHPPVTVDTRSSLFSSGHWHSLRLPQWHGWVGGSKERLGLVRWICGMGIAAAVSCTSAKRVPRSLLISPAPRTSSSFTDEFLREVQDPEVPSPSTESPLRYPCTVLWLSS